MSQYLVAVSGPLAGQRFAVTEGGVWVGRVADGNQIVVDLPEVSRRHARLSTDSGGRVRVKDHSTNGTWVEGRRITAATVLEPGQRLCFGGPQHAEFELARAAAAAAHTIQGPPRAPAGTTPGCHLEIVEQNASVRQVELKPPRLELSRQPGAGRLALEHPTVSAPHAEILIAPGGEARLRDLNSTNGTFINGERVREANLQEGDLIQLGSCDDRLLLFREARQRTLRLTDVELSQPVSTLGRGEGNTLRLSHPTVSQRHAEIRQSNGQFTITDLGSTNGTFVNGTAVSGTQPLRVGDRISLGAVQFVFDGSHLEGQAESNRAALTALGIRVEVRDRGAERTKVLLDDISMQVEPGQFVGLLGGSGAGKSTLMDALNGSRPATQGRVLVNQCDLYREYAAVRSLIGYVPQDDILHAQLSVRECLYYSARLRLPDDYSETALHERVGEVVKVLELTDHAAQPIHSLSGGQRKRVSVGIELLSNPSLLFLDEPTAGQDPKNELQMMQLFRRIANQGASVIINTHLLGSFGLLDRVAVLVGGRMAFYGPAPEMLGYFGCTQPHEVYYRLKEDASPAQWGQQYRESAFYPRYADAGGTRLADARTDEASAGKAQSRHSAWRQLGTIWSRQLSLKFKDKGSLAMLAAPPGVIALLIGIMNLASHGAGTYYPNSPMSLFMTVLVGLWFGCSATVREIVDEAAVYRRERQRELKITSYLGSKLLYLGVIAGAQSGLYLGVMALLHVMINHLGAAWLLLWLITVQGGLIGLLISALARSAEQALYVFPLVMIAELLFAGMLIPTAPITPFFPVAQVEQGQVRALQVIPPPAWFHGTNPPMSALLRNTLSAAAVSRWSLEGLTDIYASDGSELADCYATQSQAAPRYDCGYSVALLDSVALTLHREAAPATAAYLTAVGAALARHELPPPAPPRQDRLPEYVAVQAAFAAVMVALLGLAMRKKEGRHGG